MTHGQRRGLIAYDAITEIIEPLVIDIVSLGGERGVTNAQMLDALDHRLRLRGLATQEFWDVAYRMARRGELRTWRERRPNKAGRDQVQRIFATRTSPGTGDLTPRGPIGAGRQDPSTSGQARYPDD